MIRSFIRFPTKANKHLYTQSIASDTHLPNINRRFFRMTPWVRWPLMPSRSLSPLVPRASQIFLSPYRRFSRMIPFRKLANDDSKISFPPVPRASQMCLGDYSFLVLFSLFYLKAVDWLFHIKPLVRVLVSHLLSVHFSNPLYRTSVMYAPARIPKPLFFPCLWFLLDTSIYDLSNPSTSVFLFSKVLLELARAWCPISIFLFLRRKEGGKEIMRTGLLGNAGWAKKLRRELSLWICRFTWDACAFVTCAGVQ